MTEFFKVYNLKLSVFKCFLLTPSRPFFHRVQTSETVVSGHCALSVSASAHQLIPGCKWPPRAAQCVRSLLVVVSHRVAGELGAGGGQGPVRFLGGGLVLRV